MKIRLLLGIIALFTLMLGSVAWWVNHTYQQQEITPILWQAQFVDLKGNVQKIPRPNTRPLVVNFWASWCGPCREEMPELAELALLFQEQVDFVGIAVDNMDEVQQFLMTMKVPYPIWLGQADTLALMKAEGNTSGGLPFTVVYTANGHPMMTMAGKVQKDTLKALLQSAIAASPQQISEKMHKTHHGSY